MAAQKSNWIYLFHGEDELSSQEAVHGLEARMKDSPGGEFNVTSFDGDRFTIQELAATCQTMPFLSDKRLVVVHGLISRLSDGGRSASSGGEKKERAARGSKKAMVDGLIEMLRNVPDCCRLVFLEGQLIPERDPILKAMREMGCYIKANRLEEAGLLEWVHGRAKKLGCKITPDAAEELAAAVGPDARLLNSELTKLATYCLDRPIRPEDVAELVSDARKANVFALVDAMGQRQGETALRELRKLMEDGEHPLRLVAMVIRQFRLLIQVKELSAGGASPDEVGPKVGVTYRTAQNLQRQARNFSFAQMEDAYRKLLEFDVQVKTGAREPEAALELLIADLVRAA